jgi:prophage regulatory protein
MTMARELPDRFNSPLRIPSTRSTPASGSVAEGDGSRPPEAQEDNNGSVVSEATPTRLLRFPAVRDRTGLSRSTIWRLERRGEFPRHRQISPNAVAWVEEEITQWIQSRVQRGTALATATSGAGGVQSPVKIRPRG